MASGGIREHWCPPSFKVPCFGFPRGGAPPYGTKEYCYGHWPEFTISHLNMPPYTTNPLVYPGGTDNIDALRNKHPKIRNIHEINPERLADEYGVYRYKVWRFITLRGKRYQNEATINLVGGVGYWKRISDDSPNSHCFNFYHPSDDKSSWIMHLSPYREDQSPPDAEVDSWFYCVIYDQVDIRKAKVVIVMRPPVYPLKLGNRFEFIKRAFWGSENLLPKNPFNNKGNRSDGMDAISIDTPMVRNIYEINPEKLHDEFGVNRGGRKEWMFYTLWGRQYDKDTVIDHCEGNAYWERVLRREEPLCNPVVGIIGVTKTFKYYKGIHPSGDESSWMMDVSRPNDPKHMLGDWVLCKIYSQLEHEPSAAKVRKPGEKPIKNLEEKI